jgi:hypothetical protein
MDSNILYMDKMKIQQLGLNKIKQQEIKGNYKEDVSEIITDLIILKKKKKNHIMYLL